MIQYRELAVAILAAIVSVSCSDGGNSVSVTSATATNERYYIAAESASGMQISNGVDAFTGAVNYAEEDLSSTQLSLVRLYSSNLGDWQISYNNQLGTAGVDYAAWKGLKSKEYFDAETACEAGWQELKSIAYNGVLQAAEVTFNAGLCEIKLNNQIIARLPVQGSNSSYPIRVLTRADGSHITFYQHNGSWAATNGETYQLQSASSGWSVTTPEGEVENYNAEGKLTSITNTEGQITTLSYNSAGQLEQIASPFGQTITLRYSNNKLMKASDATGSTTYTYNTAGKLSEVTYPDDSTHSYAYDTNGRLTSISDADGTVVVRYTYDSVGRVTETEGADGSEATAFAYNGAETSVTDVANATTDNYLHSIIKGVARVTRTTDSEGVSETTEYDTNGYPIKTVDKNGLVTLTAWSTRGLPESVTTAAGTPDEQITLTEWHSKLRKPIREIKQGIITLYEYDDEGRLTSTTLGSSMDSSLSASLNMAQIQTLRRLSSSTTLQSAGYNVQKTSTAYDKKGQPVKTTAPDGAVTTYDYDAQGNQTSVTNALNQTTKVLEFDKAGRAIKVQDENGNTTESQYDKGGRLISETRAGQTTTYSYNKAGKLTKTLYPDGSYTQTTYNAAGNIASSTDSQGNTRSYTYDRNGNQLTETLSDAVGTIRSSSQNKYNAHNQLIQSTDTEGNVTSYAYDKIGNQIQVTDAKGRITYNAYDTQNRLVKTTDPAGGVTQYSYDARGNRTTVMAPNNAATAYTYNYLGQMTSEGSPDRGNAQYTYDTSGNLKTSTDANGNITTYEYDLLNRKTKTIWSDGSTATWSYDTCANGVGRLCMVTDGSGSTTYQYDNQGHVTRKEQNVGG